MTRSSCFAAARLVVETLLATALVWALAGQRHGDEGARTQSKQLQDSLAALEARLAILEADRSFAMEPVENPSICDVAALVKALQRFNELDVGVQTAPSEHYLTDKVVCFPAGNEYAYSHANQEQVFSFFGSFQH